MRSLLKKKGDKGLRAEVLAWHPDFRDLARLPDTKTVRTKFFVNVIVVAITAGLSLHVALREFRLASLKGELAIIEANIADTKGLSDKAVAAYKKYQAEEKAFNEAYNLVKSTFSFPDFLMRLGSLLPNGVRISRVDFRGGANPITVSGSVKGLDTTANDVASQFVQTLQADEELKKTFATVTLTSLGRNAAEGNMGFELSFVPKK